MFFNTDYRLLRVNPNSKIPAENHGVKDARPRRPEADFLGFNVGIAGGNGLVIVDVDPRNGGLETLEMLESKHGKLPDTWTVDTPSRGRHYYFKGETKSHSLRGIDVISNGKYALCPPSKLAHGAYVWLAECAPDECAIAELPSYFKIEERDLKEKPVFSGKPIDSATLEKVQRLFVYLDPDCDRNLWIQIGMGLHSTKHSAAFDLFNRWSSGEMHNKTAAKYDGPKGIERVWSSFREDGGITIASVIDILEDARITSGEIFEELEVEEVHVTLEQSKKQAIPHSSSPLLNQLQDEILRYAYIKNPEFAFAASLSILSAITQRGYQINYNRGKTSTYQMILGPAACGKESYLSAVGELIKECDARLVCGEVRSDQAMKQVLSEFPSRTIVLDEFSDRIYNAYKLKGADNDLQLMRIYKELWAIKKTLPGSVVKKSKDNESIKEVEWPMLSLFGAGTLDRFHDCLNNPDFIDGGMFGRLDLFLIKKRNEQDFDGGAFEFTEDLKTKLKDVYTAGIASFISDGIKNVPDKGVTIEVGSRGLELFKEFRKLCLERIDNRDARERNIYDRAPEKAMRYGALHCIGKGSSLMDEADMVFGIETAKYLVQNAYEMIHLDTESEHARRLKALAQAMNKEYVSSGKTKLTIRALYRHHRAFRKYDRKTRNDALGDLGDLGLIKFDSRRGSEVEILRPTDLANFGKNK